MRKDITIEKIILGSDIMNEKIKNIDFQKVDWSKYQNQIDDIYQTYEELKKDKKLIRLLKKLKKQFLIKLI